MALIMSGYNLIIHSAVKKYKKGNMKNYRAPFTEKGK